MTTHKVHMPGPVLPPGKTAGVSVPKGQKVEGGQSFGQILGAAMARQSLKFSQHAQARIQERNIGLVAQDIARLARAVDKAAEKGARESVVLMDELAFVVSIKNRTVITVVDGENLKENVFTSIDSAVVI